MLRYATNDGAPASEKRRIISEKLDYTNRAGTASEILRDVLGLSSTLPEWVEADLQRIVNKYQTEQITQTNLDTLRSELKAAGLDELFPEALSKLSRTHDKA